MKNLKSLLASIDISFAALRDKLTISTWLIILSANLITVFFERSFLTPHHDTLLLRLIVCLAILPLFSSKTVYFKLIQPYHKAYFLFSAFLLLPFMFSLMLLLNQETQDSSSAVNSIWFFEYFIASSIFTGLVSRLRVAATLHVVAFLVCLPFVIAESQSFKSIGPIVLGMLAVQITSLSYSLLTHRNMNFVSQEKISAAYSVGASVAHEIRTPLLTIKNLAIACEKSIEHLKASGGTNSTERIRENLKTIQKEVEHSNTVIDMLLINTRSGDLLMADEPIVVSKLLREVIERYPFNNRTERKLITINGGIDFKIFGSQLLLLHAIMNLVKNSLAATQMNTMKKIEIRYGLSDKPTAAYIDVVDSGPGVNPALGNRVFRSFVTTSTAGVGSGIGLPFCKSVVTQMGGKLSYCRIDSRTHFIMKFSRYELHNALAPPHSSPH